MGFFKKLFGMDRVPRPRICDYQFLNNNIKLTHEYFYDHDYKTDGLGFIISDHMSLKYDRATKRFRVCARDWGGSVIAWTGMSIGYVSELMYLKELLNTTSEIDCVNEEV